MSERSTTRPFGAQGVDQWTALTVGLVACALAADVLTVALSYWNLYHYGGAFDLPAQLLVRLSPLGVFETRHALVALIGLAGLVGASRPVPCPTASEAFRGRSRSPRKLSERSFSDVECGLVFPTRDAGACSWASAHLGVGKEERTARIPRAASDDSRQRGFRHAPARALTAAAAGIAPTGPRPDAEVEGRLGDSWLASCRRR